MDSLQQLKSSLVSSMSLFDMLQAVSPEIAAAAVKQWSEKASGQEILDAIMSGGVSMSGTMKASASKKAGTPESTEPSASGTRKARKGRKRKGKKAKATKVDPNQVSDEQKKQIVDQLGPLKGTPAFKRKRNSLGRKMGLTPQRVSSILRFGLKK